MAARFFVNGGVDNNWSTTGNWSLTSGGAGGQAVPTASDDVTFDTNSPNCTVNTSARVCKTLTCTAYTNTLTFTFKISVSGNITLGASMIFAGAATDALTAHAAGTLTSNGKTVSVPMTFDVAATYTLADSWTVTSTVSSKAVTVTVNGNTMNCGGAVTATTGAFSGTTLFNINGTGTFNVSGGISNDVTFNSAGTISFPGAGSCVINGGTWTYVSGITTTNGAGLIPAGSCTLNLAGTTWSALDLELSGGITITLTSLLSITRLNSGLILYNGTSSMSVIFAGSAGFTTNYLDMGPSQSTITLTTGLTYTILTGISLPNPQVIAGGVIDYSSGTSTIKSATVGVKATLVVNAANTSAKTCIIGATITDIDSSGGSPLFAYRSTLSNTLNWANMPATTASTF